MIISAVEDQRRGVFSPEGCCCSSAHLASPVPSGVYVEERKGKEKERGGDVQAIMCQIKTRRRKKAGKDLQTS